MKPPEACTATKGKKKERCAQEGNMLAERGRVHLGAPGRWLSIRITRHSARVISNLGSTSVEKARVTRFDNTWIMDSTFSDAGKDRLLIGISFKSKPGRSLRCIRLISGQCFFKCRQSIACFHHFQHGRESREIHFIPFGVRNLGH